MDMLEKLKAEYRASLPQKLDTIRITVAAVLRSLESKKKPDWENLEFIIHKFAGSSGTYGFKEMSAHARSLEERISENIFATKTPAENHDWLTNWLEQLETFMEKKAA